ncbi:MAG: EAL domain-containing protein [Oceanospirillaceae bacterium]
MLKETDLHIFDNFHSAMWVYDSSSNRIHWANNEAMAFWRKKSHQDLYDLNFSVDRCKADAVITQDDLEDLKFGKEKSYWCSFTPSDIAKEVYCHFSGIELNDGRIETLIQVIVSKVSLDSELSVHTSSTLVSLWDTSGQLTSANKSFKNYYGNHIGHFHQLFTAAQLSQNIWQKVLEQGEAEQELCLPTLTGNRWFQINLFLSKKGYTEHVTLRQLDTTSRKHRELHHQKLATTDQLTQLHNRFGITLVTEKIINEHLPFTLFLIDLDKFKQINDYYGHEKGDVLLQAVAFRLQSTFTNALAISRLGGDEFLLLMPVKGQTSKQDEGSRLARCLNTPYHISGLGNVQSGASIGAVSFPSDANNMSELLLLADTAMYCAKASRFDDCSYFNPDMAQPLLRRQKIRNSLNNAIDNHELSFHLEPILFIDDRTIAYNEIQICWDHPELGILQREEFELIADELSVMHKIEMQTLEHACLQIAKDTQHLPILINVSINELQSGRTYENLLALKEPIKAIPFSIQISIVEADIAGREIAVARQLKKITDMNIAIVLDDFSVGGLNLIQLSEMPINIIRFHKDFTHAINTNNKGFLQQILYCARQAKYQVICRGVSDMDTIKLLLDLGCDFIQDTPTHLIHKKPA